MLYVWEQNGLTSSRVAADDDDGVHYICHVLFGNAHAT
jgi:hypothetical protein